ncbi:hypothetical protein ACJMK2_031743 [Sinanodonta woodiana]|uniref:Uncharacterized protein n=1 Tax=Sinanodonta woodiana TaxID=1069815 RepID=A0ABD3X3K7_SINWO
MVLHHLWISILFVLTAVRTTGSTFSGTEKDIMHAIAGNPFMIRTWCMIDSTLFITIKKDNNIILDLAMGVGIATNSTVQNRQMMLVFNNTIQKLYLWFKNVSKEDGGIYEMNESFYRTDTIPDETEADTYDRKGGTWFLEIYVLGPGEIKKGYVGGNISMEFEKSIKKQSILHNYDDHCALLVGTSCVVLTDSYFYGRLRCATDDSGRMYKITIVNVSQRDAGIYKVASGKNETGRYFFSIEDSPTCAVVGDNMTIGWFYNQQGIQQTLRLIHPNQGVMMLLRQTNYPQIKGNFQHRLLYNGDTLQSFVSFTLLNVSQSDAGLYTIETLHGNIIPGSKELNVEVPVPVYVFPITIGIFLVINVMMCYIIWIRLKRARSIEPDRHEVFAKCDADLYITPIASERPLLIPSNEDVSMHHTNASQNAQVNKSTEIVPMVSSPCMGEYDMIPISSNDDFKYTLHNIDNNADSQETSITQFRVASDYLTVEFVMDSDV